MAITRHTISGVIDKNTPQNILEHPVLGRYLEVVDEDTKPFVPALHVPREAKDAGGDEPEKSTPVKNKSKD